MFGYILVAGFNSYQRMENYPLKSVASVLLSFFIVIMIESSKAQPLDWDPINVYFWVFLGIMTRLPLLDKQPEKSKD
jgi:hypothetical protein